jgi:hypothetical protein
MPARRELTMRQMLRLHRDGVSAREIARTLGVARSTIQDNLGRARRAGIDWPLPAELTDEALQERLSARSGVKPGRRRHSEPDWTALARELKRPGVNLMVLWEEYRASHPDGYGYSAVAARALAIGAPTYKSIDAEARALEHAEWLGLLLEHEVTLRRQKRFEARARTARLRHSASVEDVDYRAARGLDRALFLKLSGCDFIRERRNLLITGPCSIPSSAATSWRSSRIAIIGEPKLS